MTVVTTVPSAGTDDGGTAGAKGVMNIVMLAVVGLLLLVGLVALAVGHKRWSWGTVAAAILVLLTTPGYLYLAARLAARERNWVRVVKGYETKLARSRDALVPGSGGFLGPSADEKSLTALADERDRWQRALDSVDTWRDRSWGPAAFEPPRGVDQPGRLLLPPDGNAENTPPLDAGATVFVFDDAPIQDGGRYLGEFRVVEPVYDANAKQYALTVARSGPPDAYDAELLGRDYEAVTIYESLPADRWQAFSRTAASDDLVMPRPTKSTIEEIEALIKDRQQLDLLGRHEEQVPQEEWQPLLDAVESDEPSTTHWALVEFTADHTFPPVAGADPAAEEKGTYTAGAKAEFDLRTAVELQKGGVGTIVGMIYRRPLSDPQTALLGSQMSAGAGGGEVRADGLAFLMQQLRVEIGEIDASISRLGDAKAAAEGQTQDLRTTEDELDSDLQQWNRDVQAAERTATAFGETVRRTGATLAATERDIVLLGTELDRLVGRLTAAIDEVAPPPDRLPAATGR